VTTNLTVLNLLTSTVDAQICQGQSYTLPDGSSVSASGSYPVTLTSSAGCDSIVTTNLTVLNVLTSTVNAQICQGQSYTLPDGSSVSASGSYAVTLTSSAGCDSIVTTNLTVLNVLTSTVNAQICQGQSYTLPDGSSVSASGSYAVTLTSSAGCDSIVTTNLTVVNVLTSTVNAQICQGQSYTLPDGSSVSASGSYPVTLTSSGGCDSIVTTNLTVSSILNSTVDAEICEGGIYLLPNGVAVGTAGSYPVTLTSSGGCDSIVTTNLTVNRVVNLEVDVSICEGSSYFAGGAFQTQSGTYLDIFPGSNGCDSVVTTNLTVTKTIRVNTNAQICSGQSYTLPGGRVVSVGGVYNDTLTSAGGCDSVITTVLTVLGVSSNNVSAEICEGETYTLPDGSIVQSAGAYTVVLTGANGCDSTIIINIAVKALPQPVIVDATTICIGDSFVLTIQPQPDEVVVWPDGSGDNTYIFTKTGSYTVTISNECGTVNSIIEVNAEDCSTCEVFLPNAFTPNGDGVNDRFTPILTCEDVVPLLFRVYNRWNELVFETNQPGIGWDGSYKGEQQPTDSYIYYVSYFNVKQGKTLIKKGVVTKLN
jgi:gliding motility-associated-like protein